MAESSSTPPWERITHFYHGTRKPIHVVTTYNADAAAATLTLTSLLKSSLIAFSVHPIATYDELQDVVEQANLAQDFARASETEARVDELFLLIGLGGPVPLSTYFDFTRHAVMVLDAYRPVHFDNLRGEDGERLLLWGSASIRQDIDTFFRSQREAEAARRRRRRRRREDTKHQRSRAEYVSGNDDCDDEGGEISDFSSASSCTTDDDDDVLSDYDDNATPSQSQERVDWMEAAEVPPYMERLYYAAECAGRSCAVEVYHLAVLLSRVKDAMLWHAAVGVCDLFRRRLIDYSTYLVEMRPLHDAVSLQLSNRRGALEQLSDEAVNRHRRSATNAMQLQNLNDDQLLLLRHSCLWDAIWYHPLLASVLGLHHIEEGEGFLSQLLASRCGVSRERARQPWRELPTEVRKDCLPHVQRELQHILENKGSFTRHPNQIRCVTRTIGYSTEVSTFDACELFDAVLAAVPPAALYNVEDTENVAVASARVKERMRDFRRGKFWEAASVLDADPNHTSFTSALQEAFSLQRAIASATGALMQPGMLHSTRSLHYAQPNDPNKTTSALESFNSVYRLGALASRLLYTLTAERGVGRYTAVVRPLLLSCTVPRPNMKATTAPTSSVDMMNFSSTGATGRAAGAGLADMAGDDTEYIVLLSHGGSAGGAAMMSPLPTVGRFLECVHDEDEFALAPRQNLSQRNAVLVKGRESAIHVAELIHLRSLERWDPRRDHAMMQLAQRDEEVDGEEVEEKGEEDDEAETNLLGVVDDSDNDEGIGYSS